MSNSQVGKFNLANLKCLSCGWFNSPGYRGISKSYGDRTTERSGVKLINHIDEGLKILSFLDADYVTAEAYCLHPLTQTDDALSDFFQRINDYPGRAIALAIEYRHAANSFLSRNKKEEYRPSCLYHVRDMLITDKIQNRKDFELYHKGTHPNSERLTEYFNEWMSILQITEEEYQAVKWYLIANP